MKKYFKSLLLSSFVLSISIINADNMYREELEKLKKEDPVLNGRVNSSIRNLENNINNYKRLNFFSRIMRFVALRYGVIVTKDSMPKLYGYIQTICDDNDIAVPIVLISKDESLFNAFAQKMLTTTGAIVIGQGLFKKFDDEALEAVIAHELGHIKKDHVNKDILTFFIVYKVLSYLDEKYPLNWDIGYEISIKWKGKRFPYGEDVAYVMLTSIITQLIIGKKFEKEADNFAFKVGRAKGLKKFFEYLLKQDVDSLEEMKRVEQLLSDNKKNVASHDYFLLLLEYYQIKYSKAMDWVYHNTRLGAHPSNEARIAAAEEFLKKQAEGQ